MMTTPMLSGLRRSLPGAEITLLLWPNASASWLPVIETGQSMFDDILWDDAFGAYSGAIGFRNYVRLLKKRRFDAAISLHGGSRTGLAWRLAGIPIRIGNVRREISLLFNHNHNQRRRTPDRHEVEYDFDLARPLGVDGKPGRMFWPIGDNDRREAASLLDAAGRVKGRPYIVINPTHGGSSRSWPGSRFADTARELSIETGAHILLIGGPEHIAANQIVAAAIGGGVLNLTGATTLSALAAVCESAMLHISVDTGTMHLAAAMGTPCVAIFPLAEFWDQRVRWQPWMTERRVVGPTIRCSDCLPQKCKRTQTTCIDSISVDEVVSASKDLISSTV
jgi:heptosyltransferase-3